MRRLSFAGLALMAGLVVFLWLRTRTEDTGGPAPLEAPTTRRATGAAAVDAQDDVAAAGRAAIAVATSRAQPAAELVTLRGRCVAAEDLRPLAGMRVSFRGQPSSRELAVLDGGEPLDLPDPSVPGE